MKLPSGVVSLGLLVAGVLAAAPPSEGAPSAVAASDASALIGDAAAGKETFTQYCSICHGARAKGFIGPYIAGINWTTPGLHAVVRGGIGGYGGMPAFNADAVTDANIADIAAYLATLPAALAPKSPTTPTTSPTFVVATAQAPASRPTSSAAGAVSAAASAGSSLAQQVPSGAGDPAHGSQIYSANCAACHGANAQGGIGPSLRGEKTRKNAAAAIVWIKNPQPPMPKLYPSVLSEKDVEDVATYVESL